MVQVDTMSKGKVKGIKEMWRGEVPWFSGFSAWLTEAYRNYFWSCLYLKSRLFAARRGALRLSANADELALSH
jgi:hypothetical protein